LVQVKFRGDQSKKLSWSSDKLSNLIGHTKSSGHIVFSNASGVCKNTSNQAVNLQTILIQDLLVLQSQDFYHIWNRNAKRKRTEKLNLRDYQKEAVKNAITGLKTKDRGQLIMPCRSGKTVTSLSIHENINSKLTLICVPTLSLVKQFKNDWLRYRSKSFDYFCVCSDRSVESSEINIYEMGNVGLGVTTCPIKIKEMVLSVKGDNLVVFTTYSSVDKVAEGFKGLDLCIDFAICDEAHMTATTMTSYRALIHSNSAISISKRLYMTATPKIFSDEFKRARDSDSFCDMTNTEIFGPIFYKMSFAQAIEKNVISDYLIYAPTVSNSEMLEYINNRRLTNDGDAEFVANCVAVNKAMSKFGLQNMISFHSTNKKSKKFAKLFKGLKSENNSFSVDGDMSANNRHGVVKAFSKSAHSVLSNSKCLTEGVTIHSADGVIFSDPKYSVIDIVQAASRCLNVKPDGRKSIIIVPIYIGDGENHEDVVNNSAFKSIVNVVRAMAAHDEVLDDEIKSTQMSIGKRKSSSGYCRPDSENKVVFNLDSISDKLKEDLGFRLIQKIVKLSDRGTWTKEKVIKLLDEKQYRNIADFSKDASAAYCFASPKLWYQDLKTKYFPDQMRYWSKEKVIEVLEKHDFKTLKDWESVCSCSLSHAKKRSWYGEIIEKYNLKNRIEWTKDLVVELLERNKFNCIARWEDYSPSSVNFSRSQTWHSEIQDKYFPGRIKKRSKKEIINILNERQYSNLKEWRENDPNSYAYANTKKWYKKVRDNYFHNNEVVWTEKSVIELLEQKRYKNVASWESDEGGSCRFARKLNSYKEITDKYFPNKIKRWSESSARCVLEKHNFKTITEWKKVSCGSYHFARQYNLLNTFKRDYNIGVNTRWSKEKIIELLIKNNFATLTDWEDNSGGSCAFARSSDWYEEVKNKYFPMARKVKKVA
jgi:superfamily II DNA or RNA helicase